MIDLELSDEHEMLRDSVRDDIIFPSRNYQNLSRKILLMIKIRNDFLISFFNT